MSNRAAQANGSDPITPPQIIKTAGPITIGGVGEMAGKLPDDAWYELRLHIRKIDGGAEVKVFPNWERQS